MAPKRLRVARGAAEAEVGADNGKNDNGDLSAFPPSYVTKTLNFLGNVEFQPKHRLAQSSVYAEQVAFLYSHGALVYSVTVINALILVALEWSYVAKHVLVTWLILIVTLTAARSLLALLYQQTSPNSRDCQKWYTLFLVGVALSGMVWGSSGFFLFPTDNLGRQMVLIMVLAGMTAAAVTVLSARMEVFLVYAIPTLVPLAANLYMQGTTLSTTMSAITCIFLIGMSISAHGAHKSIMTSLKLRFDNRELVEEVENRQRAEEALFREKERLQITFESLAEGVIIVSANNAVEYLNPAAERLCGWINSAAHGRSTSSIFGELKDYKGDPACPAVETCLKTSVRCEKQISMKSRHGKQQLIEEIATPLKDRNGTTTGAVSVIRDVTQAYHNSQLLVHQANHDALTGLPNRTLLLDRLNHAIAKATRANSTIALFFMDLDRFKTINDSLGHSAGDILLRGVAEHLLGCVRNEDTVARLGGDEFIIVLENIKDPDTVSATARKIMHSFTKPFAIRGQDIFVTASIGITLFPKDGDSAELLLKNADTAMYRTKKKGRNNIEFYTRNMNAEALERLKMEQQLRYAPERKQLELYYQPQIDPNTGTITAVEALLRWHHPRYGLVLPKIFIPIAEETGSILPIGQWVLNSACQQARNWLDMGFPTLRVAVNLSVRQLRQPDLANAVARVLETSKLPPENLELEITESLFLSNVDDSITILNALKDLGVRLGIDDFGMGFSSLNYLKKFPVDVLKIDKLFIRDVTNNQGDAAIVSAIIEMGHGLNLSVIAEGIENEAQLRFLKARSIDAYQGFYIAEALKPKHITKLLRTNRVYQ